MSPNRQFAYPGVAFLIATGLSAIFYLLPQSTGPWAWTTDAVVGYALITFALFLVAVRDGGKRLALSTLLFSQVFWFALPVVLILLRGEAIGAVTGHNIRHSNVIRTVLALLIFMVGSLAAYYWLQARSRQTQAAPAGAGRTFSQEQLAVIVLLLTGVGLLPFLVFGSSMGEIVQGILGSRGADKAWAHTGFSGNPIYVIGRAALSGGAAVSLAATLRARGFIRFFFFGTFLFGFLITYFDSGTRSLTALILIPAVLFLVDQVRTSRHKVLWITAMVLGAVGIVYLAALQLQFRTAGVSPATAQMDEASMKDFDFFSETALAIQLVPERTPYVRESVAVLFLANPIPRNIWPDKPFPRTIQAYSIGRTGYDEYTQKVVSRLPSIVGQFYMSWDVWGVWLIALETGLLFSWIDLRLRRGGLTFLGKLTAAAALVWAFTQFRGLYPGFHYPILILWMLAAAETRWGSAITRPAKAVAARRASAR